MLVDKCLFDLCLDFFFVFKCGFINVLVKFFVRIFNVNMVSKIIMFVKVVVYYVLFNMILWFFDNMLF